MPLQSVLLTLLLHAAPPAAPSRYVASPFEVEKSAPQRLSLRYKQRPDPGSDAAMWVVRPDFVPLQTQIREGKIAAPLSETDKHLVQELDALRRARPEGGRWYSLPAESKTPPPEGLPVSEVMDRMLNLDRTKLTPEKGERRAEPKPRKWSNRRKMVSNLLLLEGSPTDVKKVYFKQTIIHSERTMRMETNHAIAVFEGGKLQRVVSLESHGIGFSHEGGEELPADDVRVNVMVPGYSDGKVSRLEVTRLVDEGSITEEEPEPGITLHQETYRTPSRS